MKNQLILTPENINQWKAELDEKMSKYNADNYSECMTDSEWIAWYEGGTTEEAVSDELSNW